MMLVYVKLVVAMLIWGGTWVAGRVVAADMGPFSAAFVRFFIAAVFLLVLTTRVEGRFPRLTRDKVLPVTLLGATGIFLYNAFFFSGLKYVEAGRASLIIACIPAIIALLSRVLFKERLGAVRALGIPLSLFGVLVIISQGDVAATLAEGPGQGEAFIFGCVAAWTAYSLLGKRLMSGMSPFYAVTWSCVFGDALLFGPALAEGLLGQVAAISPTIWLCLGYLGVLATGVSFSWYYQGIKAVGASRAGVFINLVPVSAITFGVILLDESVTASLVAGGAMVIGGVWLTNRPGGR